MGRFCKRFKHKCFFFASLYFILNFALFSQELVVKCTGVDIHGTLLEPSSSKVRTLCIIVPGSGPTDRDGNNIAGMQTNAYRLLAEELQNQGIASFRYDKRAIGKSIVTNLKEEEMSFETNVEDLKTIIADLKALKKFNKIFLIGHSEGSLVSILTAKTEKVDGIVSIAGVGKSAGELIINQIEANPANPQELKENAKNIVKKLQNKQRVPILDINPMLRTLFRESVQPYLISWFAYSPIKELSKLRCPCLILHGKSDSQVAIENAHLLFGAKKRGLKLLMIDGMTHTLKKIEKLDEEIKTYYDPSYPISKELIEIIVNFIK